MKQLIEQLIYNTCCLIGEEQVTAGKQFEMLKRLALGEQGASLNNAARAQELLDQAGKCLERGFGDGFRSSLRELLALVVAG